MTDPRAAILRALRLLADDDGVSWPSHAWLAQVAGVPMGDVSVALDRLKADGLIHREPRHDTAGQRLSDYISITQEPSDG